MKYDELKEYILVRHGQTDYNLKEKFQGFSDISLNETGIKQAKTARKKFKEENIDIIFCSDLVRCRQTAETISPKTEIVLTENLREMNFGVFEGLTYDEIKVKYSDEYNKWKTNILEHTIDQGESFLQMSNRVLQEFDKIRKENNRAAIVSHAGCIRTILSHHLTGNIENSWRFFIENCSITKLCFKGDYAYLKSLNVR